MDGNGNGDGVAEVYVDGGCRPNPGRGAYGYLIYPPDGGRAVTGSGDLGQTTNNKAEYAAVIAALEHASRMGLTRLHVYSDSELVVRQMSGLYRVKHPGLRPLNREALALCRRFRSVRVSHVPRHLNTQADRLCAEVLGGSGNRFPQKATEEPDLAVACPTCGRPY